MSSPPASPGFRRRTSGLKTPFLCANVSAPDGPLAPASVRVRFGSRFATVIGVFEPSRGGKSQLQIDAPLGTFAINDPEAAIVREVRIAHDRHDLAVVVGKLSPMAIRRVAARPDAPDVILSTDYSLPQWASDKDRTILTDDSPGFIGRTLVLYSVMGEYGLSVATMGIDREGTICSAAIQDRWLEVSVPDQPGIRAALNRFYDRVGKLPEAQASVQPPLGGDPYWRNGNFVGVQACQSCHQTEYEQWRMTPHASAFKTLLDKHRHYQPRCVACHVVAYGQKHGYQVGQPEHPYANVQCEVCHGPGGAHVRSPSTSNIRAEVPERVCKECHDAEHSDRFVYAAKLPLVLHHPDWRAENSVVPPGQPSVRAQFTNMKGGSQ